jgi:hypothetical protein
VAIHAEFEINVNRRHPVTLNVRQLESAMLNAERRALEEELERLAKPSLLLKDHGSGQPLAYWHEPAWCDGLRPWITLTPTLLEGISKCPLTLFENETCGGLVEERDTKNLPPTIPLFAHPEKSRPPACELDFFGNYHLVEEAEHDDYPGSEYEAFGLDMPIARDDVFAIVGGWHRAWPDDDWLELADKRLVLTTVANAEPWLEVFHGAKEGFLVKYRVT